MTQLMHRFLPKRDKHHQFDTQELSHWPDGSQFFFERLVQQHQTIHGKLERGQETDECFLNTKRYTRFCFQTASDLGVIGNIPIRSIWN